MYPAPFALERFFARHEFSARYLLSASDCQGPSMAELVAGADSDLGRRWETLTLGYTESQGLPELREAIAAMYVTAGPEQVLTAAPEELIFLTMHALLSPGDHVVCTFPGYQSLYELARSIGCEVDLWRPEEIGGGSPADSAAPKGAAPRTTGWYFDPATLESLLRPTTKLVVVNFPHNPTGALPSAADFSRIVELVASTGARLFSDEMYRLLEPTPALRLPPAADLYDRALSLAGMSKAFGLAGLRIGWVVTRDTGLLERMKALKDYTTICSSAPSEVLALMALGSPEPILEAHRTRIERNRGVAADFFAQHAQMFRWAPPQAGTVCFPRLQEDRASVGGGLPSTADSTAGGAEAFCAAVLNQTGALLLPSTMYEYGDSHFRLGLGRDDFRAGLAAVESFLIGRSS